MLLHGEAATRVSQWELKSGLSEDPGSVCVGFGCPGLGSSGRGKRVSGPTASRILAKYC